MTKFVAISDLHGNLPIIPKCDICLIAGDICPDGDIVFQSRWLNIAFRAWLNEIPAKHVVGVAGNHDLVFQKAPELILNESNPLTWHYLEHSLIKVEGFKIFGMPWSLPIWGAFEYAEEVLSRKYAQIPDDVDIVISHGPPYEIGDFSWNGSEHCGSPSLTKRILEIQPKMTVFGHIHEGRGIYVRNKTLFVNAANIFDDAPFVFDIE